MQGLFRPWLLLSKYCENILKLSAVALWWYWAQCGATVLVCFYKRKVVEVSFVAHGPFMIKLFNFMKFEYSECTGNLMHIVYYIHRKLFTFFQKGVEIDVLIENKKVTVKVTGLSEESVQEAVAMVSFLLKRILVCLFFVCFLCFFFM